MRFGKGHTLLDKLLGLGAGTPALQGLVARDARDLAHERLVVLEGQVEEDGLEMVVDLLVELAGDAPRGNSEGQRVRGVRVRRAAVHVARELVEEDEQGEGAAWARLSPGIEFVRPRAGDQVAELGEDDGVVRLRVRRGEPVGDGLVEPECQNGRDVVLHCWRESDLRGR